MGFRVYSSDINLFLFYGQSQDLSTYAGIPKAGDPAAGLQQFYRTCLRILPYLRGRTEGKPDSRRVHTLERVLEETGK